MTIGLKNMKQNRKNIVIIGEGLTEFYYFNSLRQSYRQLQIRPVYPHHASSMEELELEIDKAVDDGCPYIVCVVDMDNKKDEKEKWAYERLKKRKEGRHWIRRKGLEYEIRFIETEPCTELFFLFYFIYTTHHFGHQPELLHELNKHCLYEKVKVTCYSDHIHIEKDDESFELNFNEIDSSAIIGKNKCNFC